jgi:hypothetical protein
MKILEFIHIQEYIYYFLGFVWQKKLISPYNKTIKIDLRGVCQTHL